MSIALDAPVAERAVYLREFGIWAALSEQALHATAAAMQPVAYPKGEFIIRQGEPGRHLHVLTKGEADVRVHAINGTVITVARMSPGACFGEMSLLSGDATSADVVATADCETLTLDRSAFEALVADQPKLLREFVRLVSRRLWDSNVAMGAAREKEKGLTRFLQEAHAGQDGELVGKQPAARALQRQIEAQAALDGPLLIEGERGTGKELVARLVHFRGARRGAPLLCADCAQITETPWGDKLFGGYRPGADEQGPAPVSFLDLASGGTIVLKNVDSLPRPIQDRLAEFIERRGSAPSSAGHGVRIIATCRSSFQNLAATQKVSPALARALAGRVLPVPNLRDRKRDIPELAAHFVRKHAGRLGKPVPTLDDHSVTKLVTYDYLHGNVSEMEEAIRRAVILTDGERIDSEAIFLGQPPPPSRWTFNLLALSRPDVRRVLRLSLRAARVLVATVFAFILYQCLFGPDVPENRGAVLVWSVGWPLLVASFFFTGRACCAVCPLPAAAETAQRVVNLKWRVPAWLKRHDGTIMMAGFFAVIWAEEVTGMRHSPRATAVLLLTIGAGAVAAAVLLPRRTWCRHLCPMGGFASLGAMTGLVELRPTADICAARCSDHSCFKGGEHVEGCPLFNHVMFVDSNQHCVLCLKCVDACPNGSPQLNVRLPARDVLTSSNPSSAGRWTVMLAGLLVALVLIQHWEQQTSGAFAQMLHEQRVLTITGLLALGALVPQLILHLLARRPGRSGTPGVDTGIWQRVTAWVPVVVAGFLSYQLAFLSVFEGVRLTLGTGVGQAARGVSVAVLSIVQAGILCTGLLVTLAVLWNLGRLADDGQPHSWPRGHAVGLGVGAVYWTLLVLLILP